MPAKYHPSVLQTTLTVSHYSSLTSSLPCLSFHTAHLIVPPNLFKPIVSSHHTTSSPQPSSPINRTPPLLNNHRPTPSITALAHPGRNNPMSARRSGGRSRNRSVRSTIAMAAVMVMARMVVMSRVMRVTRHWTRSDVDRLGMATLWAGE